MESLNLTFLAVLRTLCKIKMKEFGTTECHLFAFIKIESDFASCDNIRTSKFRNLFCKNFRIKNSSACENIKILILTFLKKLINYDTALPSLFFR